MFIFMSGIFATGQLLSFQVSLARLYTCSRKRQADKLHDPDKTFIRVIVHKSRIYECCEGSKSSKPGVEAK